MPHFPLSARIIALCASFLAAPLAAQGTNIAMSGLKQDTTAPVEVTADSLQVNQAEGTAVFTGNVLIVQGTMRLAAAVVSVSYAKGDTSKIEQLHATGGVTLATATEAAEAAEAVYSPQTGIVVMTGDVMVTQGQNSMSGQRLTVDLNTGAGQMDGRVKTILQSKQGGTTTPPATDGGN